MIGNAIMELFPITYSCCHLIIYEDGVSSIRSSTIYKHCFFLLEVGHSVFRTVTKEAPCLLIVLLFSPFCGQNCSCWHVLFVAYKLLCLILLLLLLYFFWGAVSWVYLTKIISKTLSLTGFSSFILFRRKPFLLNLM